MNLAQLSMLPIQQIPQHNPGFREPMPQQPGMRAPGPHGGLGGMQPGGLAGLFRRFPPMMHQQRATYY